METAASERKTDFRLRKFLTQNGLAQKDRLF